jgi:quercetin dioxygenase-like cupin family protein
MIARMFNTANSSKDRMKKKEKRLMNMDIGETFIHGTAYTTKCDNPIQQLEWNAHPTFAGVHLKHIVKGEATEGRFSVHFVRVKAGCALGEHCHAGQWELHEVLQGKGMAKLLGKEIPYTPGVMTVIPRNEQHEVYAEEELIIMAKFVPALV